MRWDAERGDSLSQSAPLRRISQLGFFGVTLLSCGVLAVLPWMQGEISLVGHNLINKAAGIQPDRAVAA
jgi:hypothetical protein